MYSPSRKAESESGSGVNTPEANFNGRLHFRLEHVAQQTDERETTPWEPTELVFLNTNKEKPL